MLTRSKYSHLQLPKTPTPHLSCFGFFLSLVLKASNKY